MASSARSLAFPVIALRHGGHAFSLAGWCLRSTTLFLFAWPSSSLLEVLRPNSAARPCLDRPPCPRWSRPPLLWQSTSSPPLSWWKPARETMHCAAAAAQPESTAIATLALWGTWQAGFSLLWLAMYRPRSGATVNTFIFCRCQ